MTEPSSTVKAVVNDMVTRKAKFGSYEPSKHYFDKKYGCPAEIDCRPVIHPIFVYSDSKGREVANVVEYGSYKDRISFNIDNIDYLIKDTNSNGIVDKDDKILYEKSGKRFFDSEDAEYNKKEKISKFLNKK